MKVIICEKTIEETLIEIQCQSINDHIMKLKDYIEVFEDRLCLKTQKDILYLATKDIYYIEVIDGKTFFYFKNHCLEVSESLSRIENRLNERKTNFT